LLLLLSSTTADGQTVPFVEPTDGRAPIVGAFGQATQSIDLYIFRLTLPSDDPIWVSIRAAVGRGVAVRALLEPCAGDEAAVCVPPNADARLACDALTQGGSAVKWGNPAFTKTHAKTALIDNATALITTFNLVPQTFTVRRDYGVVTNEPGVLDNLSRVFAQDWLDGDPITDCAAPPARNPDATLAAYDTLIVSPDNGREQIIGTPELPGLIRSAQAPGFLKIQMEKIDPQDARGILPALVDRIQPGVQVRVLLKPPSPSEPDNAVVAERIIAAGGQAACQADLHAKMMLVDSLDGPNTFVGSQNLTRASLDRRREIGWATVDVATRVRFEQTFDADWAAAVSCTP
jgi:phosphatidylserine/phosphatidylglycerophosphate/cardiolipin synthase-like enzyme